MPLDRPFDYSIPEALRVKVHPGIRAEVSFGPRRMTGYIVGTAAASAVKKTKPLLRIIDEHPVFTKEMLHFTRELSLYYGCSWGEAIEAALPQSLRQGKPVAVDKIPAVLPRAGQKVLVLRDPGRQSRWPVYLERIKKALAENKSVIFLLADIPAVLRAGETLVSQLGFKPHILYRQERREWEEWLKVKNSPFSLVVGTRSSIFAPVNNLGLIIIDEEEDPVYKQEQVPHYHARQAALMRAKIEKAGVILAGTACSLEAVYLAQRKKAELTALPLDNPALEIKTVDIGYLRRTARQGQVIISRYLQDSIAQVLNDKGKALLFLNRRGFATFASCRNCGTTLKCPRCSINLVYYFKDNTLRCHYCNFRMPAQQICQNCNSGYIRYSGAGTEKAESELSRIFPQARIKTIEDPAQLALADADIFISTSAVVKGSGYGFELVGVLSIDNSLNRIDLRATEKTFDLLSGLLSLARRKMIIQTAIPGHYCFRALEQKNGADLFYSEELRQRKQLGFPPYRQLCLVKLRGSNEERVRKISGLFYQSLAREEKRKSGMDILSCGPAIPAKLRGNFCWQILLKASSVIRTVEFLKLKLKNFSHSGIIITLDVDPL